MNKSTMHFKALGVMASVALALSSTTAVAAPASQGKSRTAVTAPAPAQEYVDGSSLRRRPAFPPGLLFAVLLVAGAGVLFAAGVVGDKRPVSP